LAPFDEGASVFDSKHQEAGPTEPQRRLFEQEVATILASLDGNATVEHNVMIIGELSGERRQVDIYIRGNVSGEDLPIGFAALLGA
jgi:hypothetical protein